MVVHPALKDVLVIPSRGPNPRDTKVCVQSILNNRNYPWVFVLYPTNVDGTSV